MTTSPIRLAAALTVLVLGLGAQTTPPAPLTTMSVPFAENPVAVDFNGDGWNDLLMGHSDFWGSNKQVQVHLNVSSATSTPGRLAAGAAIFPSAASGGCSVAAGDFTGDGIPDVVTASGLPGAVCWSNALQLFVSSAAGAAVNLTPRPAHALSYAPHAMRVGELNGGGWPEIIVADGCNNSIRVYSVSAATGVFTETQNVALQSGGAPVLMELGDLEGDGDLDIIVGSASHVSFFQNSGGTLVRWPSLALSADEGLGVLDADADGDLDIVGVGTQNGANLGVAEQVLPGVFVPSNIPFPGGGPGRLATGDLNGDRFLDLVVTRGVGGGRFDVLAFLNTGGAPFFTLTPVAVTNATTRGANARDSVLLFDVDGVPGDDIVRVLPNLPPGQIEVWRNTTSQLGMPFPGSGADFTLHTTVSGPSNTNLLLGQSVKTAGAGDTIWTRVSSPAGTMTGAPVALGIQLFGTGTPPTPTLPGIGLHFDLGAPYAIVYNDFVPWPVPGISPGGLPRSGISLQFLVPASSPPTSGTSALLQAIALQSSGTFVSSEGHEIQF